MRPASRPLVVNLVTRLNVGGISRHLDIASTRLGEFSGVLLAGEPEVGEGSLLAEIETHGAQVVSVPNLRRRVDPVADVRAWWWLYRWLRAHRPVILMTHMAKAGALGRTAAAAAGVPIRVHTFHGHVLQGYFGPLQNLGFRLAERFLALLTTRFVAVSDEIAVAVQELGVGRGRFDVIPYGLDLGALDAGDRMRMRAELGIATDAPVVGIVGRLVPIKNHDLFLAAAARISAAVQATQFVVVGDGEQRPALERRARDLGIADRTHFTGWRSDLADVYAALDLAVCCSRNEGAPIAVIEAAAAGLPVVATNVGGMASVVSDGENGLLVASDDVEGLAGAVLDILGDRERARAMGAAGRARALAAFGTERLVADLRGLYLRLLSGARRKSEAPA